MAGPREAPVEALFNSVWIGTLLALILALPPLGIFLGIYFGSGQLVVGAVAGFAVHFVTLAFSGRISAFLTRVLGQ